MDGRLEPKGASPSTNVHENRIQTSQFASEPSAEAAVAPLSSLSPMEHAMSAPLLRDEVSKHMELIGFTIIELVREWNEAHPNSTKFQDSERREEK